MTMPIQLSADQIKGVHRDHSRQQSPHAAAQWAAGASRGREHADALTISGREGRGHQKPRP